MTPRTLTHDGETLTIAEWSQRTGLMARTIRARLNAGWSVDSTLALPLYPTGAAKLRDDQDAQIRLRLLHADFARLVKDIDQALRNFNRQLYALTADDPGVSDNFASDPKDRGHSSTQETT